MKQVTNNKHGFSLAEMLMAILILLLVSGLVAGGIPSAIRAYRKVMDTANGQVFMSTTLTCLRDELDCAREISVADDKTITYIDSDGLSCTMKLLNSGDEKGIFVVKQNTYAVGEEGNHVYIGIDGTNSSAEVNIPLVSKSASDNRFYANYVSVEYDNEKKIITFTKLKTMDATANDKEIIDVGDYSVLIFNER